MYCINKHRNTERLNSRGPASSELSLQDSQSVRRRGQRDPSLSLDLGFSGERVRENQKKGSHFIM